MNGCAGEPAGVGRNRAEALGWLRKPRDGVGDQIGYLGLRVAPMLSGVNAPQDEFPFDLCLGRYP